MSRIGKNPVIIPEGVTLDITDNLITVKGKLGELTQEYSAISIKIEEYAPIFKNKKILILMTINS